MDEKYWSLPVFGQFYGKSNTLNLEALIEADPQVIIDLGDKKASHKEDMTGVQEQTGIPTIFIEANLNTFPDAYRKLGKLLGKEEKAEQIAQYIERTVAMAKENAAKIPEDQQYPSCSAPGDRIGCQCEEFDPCRRHRCHRRRERHRRPNVSSKGGGNTINMEQLDECSIRCHPLNEEARTRLSRTIRCGRD
jgi:iron complex transport system substrate-binding protein